MVLALTKTSLENNYKPRINTDEYRFEVAWTLTCIN